MNAIHDVAELKDRVGGDKRFVDRLDKILQLDMFDAGNEPGFTTPYLYNFVECREGPKDQRFVQRRRVRTAR